MKSIQTLHVDVSLTGLSGAYLTTYKPSLPFKNNSVLFVPL